MVPAPAALAPVAFAAWLAAKFVAQAGPEPPGSVSIATVPKIPGRPRSSTRKSSKSVCWAPLRGYQNHFNPERESAEYSLVMQSRSHLINSLCGLRHPLQHCDDLETWVFALKCFGPGFHARDRASFHDFSLMANSGLQPEKSHLITFSSRLIYEFPFIFLGWRAQGPFPDARGIRRGAGKENS